MIQFNDLVTIIIRTSQEKRLPLLKNALLSVVANDYRPIEIIIVIQSEKQDFIDYLQNMSNEYSDKQVQVRIFINYTSKDQRAKNLNIGVNNANGRYIGFLDDDDVFYKHHIASLVEKLNNSESVAWAYSQVAMSICTLDKEKVNIVSLNYPFQKDKFTVKEMLKDNFIPIHSYLIDRNKCNLDCIYFDESFPVMEDYEFLLRLLHRGYPTFINEVTCEYRFYIKPSNSSSNLDAYSILDHREIENAKIWLETGERIEKTKKKLYPEYTSGLISTNKRKFLLSNFSFLNIIKKKLPNLWKLIKYLASVIQLI
ncbi:glycosyltransferase [Phormidium tenue]|uniref:Glycosyltransferase n=1 Tax=Phormidium tenue FACHB-1050 TaxID=2692857 RepID=A0ABR8CAI4_9CYAN|nr:glycosyltransferase [Phormidium tenue]MBD2317395.1 glycosyltransferase [Phormidium tenue FACHB-1050]